jgi:hypothetical protein
MAVLSAISRAVGTLTFTGQPLNTETVVIAGKTYTFQTTLTNVDGNVLIGASAAASITNLQAAINLGAGAGTLYATAMTVNPEARVQSVTATTLVVESKTPGTVGNRIPTTETLTNGSWGAATLASGTGDISTAIREARQQAQANAEILQIFDAIDQSSNSEA